MLGRSPRAKLVLGDDSSAVASPDTQFEDFERRPAMKHIDTLADIPRHHAANAATRIALHFEHRTTSWAQFNERCNQVAHGLQVAGLAEGARVAWLGKNSDRFFDVLFGAAKARLVMVPVTWRLAAGEIAFIVDDAKCGVLFVGSDHVDLVEEIRAACPSLRLVVAADGPSPGLVDFETWSAALSTDEPQTQAQSEDVVLQLYTSGTTGLPKGAQLTNANLIFSTRLAGGEELGRWREDDVNVLPLPLFHAGGIAYGLNGPYWGATTVVSREASPQHIMQAMRASPLPVTRLGVVPAVMQMLLEFPDFDPTPFKQLRTLTYGGSPIPPAVVQRAEQAFGPVLLQLFGMTETATVGTGLLPADHSGGDMARLTSCGRPLTGVEVRTVRADGKLAEPRESGEIQIRCGAVMLGYWNRPEANVEVLQDGWYCTGDVGFFDEEGYLTIQDRIKDLVISGGENIYPAEVERVLAGHPSVADVAVIGVPDAQWGEAVKAVVVLRPGAEADEANLIAYARQSLAGYKCPKTVDFADLLPRNATGKLLKRVLREPYWGGQARAVA